MSKKKLVAAILVMTLVLLAGCGSPGGSDNGTAGETPGEEAVNPTVTENDQGGNPANPPNNTTGTAALPEADDDNETTDSEENDTNANLLAVA